MSSTTRFWWMAPCWWMALCAALLGSACSRGEAPPTPVPCPEVAAGTPVDPVLLAFLGRARAAHHSADIFEERGDLSGAVRVLHELVSDPRKIPERIEAHEVVADTRARLADYKSRLGQFEEAEREVVLGKELVKEPTYFRGHLFEVEGLIAERQAKELRAEGNTEAAKTAEALALDAFEKAMSVQQQVIERALPKPAPSR